MTNSKKTYVIDNLKQLIDINGDTVNFEADFVVSNKEGREFEMLVVDQTTLDNSEKLDYKKVKGQISGKVRSDKNVYQNYFLILKSEKPIELEVSINKVEVNPADSTISIPSSKKDKNGMWYNTMPPQAFPKKEKGKKDIFIFLLIIGLLIVGAFLFYKFYWSKKSSTVPRGNAFNSFNPNSPYNSPFNSPFNSIDPTRDIESRFLNRRERRKTVFKPVDSESESSSPEIRRNISPEPVTEIRSEPKKEVRIESPKASEPRSEPPKLRSESPLGKVASPERVTDEPDIPLSKLTIDKSIGSSNEKSNENSNERPNEKSSIEKPILKPSLNQKTTYSKESLLNRLKNISALKHEDES
jgi:hypothetical protein